MIKFVFFDIDETLIWTSAFDPEQEHVHFSFDDENDKSHYYTIIHPSALELLAFSRNLVGKDNVFILTTSTEDYANKVNELAGFGFDSDHILHRGTLQDHKCATAYGGSFIGQCKLADPNNVLIDNLPPRENYAKMSMIGINFERYLKVDDYFGVNYGDDPFAEDVKQFLTNKQYDNN